VWKRIGWWESRRVPYNLIVGNEFGLPDPPIFGVFLVLLYGIGANLCYTFGWIGELSIARLWPREADRFASRSFSLGLPLSVLLTLTPGLILLVAGILGLYVISLARSAELETWT
jgi:hypothetical protein